MLGPTEMDRVSSHLSVVSLQGSFPNVRYEAIGFDITSADTGQLLADICLLQHNILVADLAYSSASEAVRSYSVNPEKAINHQ